jgi:pyruvate dehydrogenase E2 component (dihydrolipoamide acetyltransferase)
MAEIVYMPKLSDTMTEGVVAAWTKNVGDAVKTGEILAEIETDKATMEFESFYDGVLLYIGVETGKTAPVNAILAIIGDKGEDIASLITTTPEVPVISEKEVEKEVEEKKEAVPTPVIVQEKAPVAEEKTIPLSSNSGRIFASPLAKKLAKEKGIDIAAVSGTGENGRIIKKDVDHYTPYKPANRIFSQAPLGVEGFTDEPVSQMRKTISRRLAESKFSAPHFYLTLDIDMDEAINIRKGLNSVEGVKVSFNDLVVKAVGLALTQHPTVNSAWMGDFIRKNQHVHVGVAVAVEDGLLVPVIRFADTKGILEIAAEVREYVQKAKDKKLQPSDWEGNTFTISNLGMFGIESFTAIINAPDSCIMAVGGIKEVPVVKNGQIVPGNIMKVTLSCDHRVVDGASGAAFLQTFKLYMENPVSMLI